MKPDRHSAFDLEKQTISNNLEFLLSSRIRYMNNFTSLIKKKRVIFCTFIEIAEPSKDEWWKFFMSFCKQQHRSYILWVSWKVCMIAEQFSFNKLH